LRAHHPRLTPFPYTTLFRSTRPITSAAARRITASSTPRGRPAIASLLINERTFIKGRGRARRKSDTAGGGPGRRARTVAAGAEQPSRAVPCSRPVRCRAAAHCLAHGEDHSRSRRDSLSPGPSGLLPCHLVIEFGSLRGPTVMGRLANPNGEIAGRRRPELATRFFAPSQRPREFPGRDRAARGGVGAAFPHRLALTDHSERSHRRHAHRAADNGRADTMAVAYHGPRVVCLEVSGGPEGDRKSVV